MTEPVGPEDIFARLEAANYKLTKYWLQMHIKMLIHMHFLLKKRLVPKQNVRNEGKKHVIVYITINKQHPRGNWNKIQSKEPMQNLIPFKSIFCIEYDGNSPAELYLLERQSGMAWIIKQH